MQLATSLSQQKQVLRTGGGALNHYLIKQLQASTAAQIILPEPELIHYKEAIIFALLGVLKLRNEINTLSSVTGASRDSSGGVIFKS